MIPIAEKLIAGIAVLNIADIANCE